MYCKRCGAPLYQGVLICPDCGARQRKLTTEVRCARCRKRVKVGLSVCPHCGRSVQPASPRWERWLAFAIIVVFAALWGLGKLPLERVAQEVVSVREKLSGLVQMFGPAEPVESQAAEEQTPVALAMATEAPTPTRRVVAPTAAIEPTETQVPIETVTPVTGTLTAASAAVTVTLALTPTAGTPVSSPAPALTPATPTPALSPTAPPPTPKASPTGAPTARTTYRVQAGDTLSTIAAKFGITWQELAAANGLTANSVLQIGQELAIPGPGGQAPPTATPRPRPTATPTAAPTPSASLPAPVLREPGDGTPYEGKEAFIELVWEAVPGMVPGNEYYITVRWVEQGTPQEHTWGTTATSTRMPLWLWGKDDQIGGRQYTWSVMVVQKTTDGKGNELIIPLSPPSPQRILYWN